ncbi:MAG TPA: tripartite tricarboxylate transporter permease [Bacillota bacterium]|nr:tripartite tricarboxylate transporter permease [Bacillota bacterium]
MAYIVLIQPGPFFLTNQPVLSYGIFIAFLVAAIFMLIIQSYGIRLFVRIINVPFQYLLPIIIVLCTLGSFAINNRMFDVGFYCYSAL